MAGYVWKGWRPEPPEPELSEPTQINKCGTEAGYDRHRRRLEQPCEPCTLAASAARRHRKQLARKAA